MTDYDMGRIHAEAGAGNNTLAGEYEKAVRTIAELRRKLDEKERPRPAGIPSSDAARLRRLLDMQRKIIHDLSQPLTVLLGHCELIEMCPLPDPEIASHVESIRLCANKFRSIIKRLDSLRGEVRLVAGNAEWAVENEIRE